MNTIPESIERLREILGPEWRVHHSIIDYEHDAISVRHKDDDIFKALVIPVRKLKQVLDAKTGISRYYAN